MRSLVAGISLFPDYLCLNIKNLPDHGMVGQIAFFLGRINGALRFSIRAQSHDGYRKMIGLLHRFYDIPR